MSDKRGYFPHYRVGGAWGRDVLLKITTRTVSDRINPRVSTRYKGEGLCLGANVQVLPTACVYMAGYAKRPGGFTAQVWERAEAPYGRARWWWVVDGQDYFRVEECDLVVLGHCHDEPLEGVA